MPDDSVTGLLVRWRAGDREALDALTPLVYDELRRIAARHLRRDRPGHTLQTTAPAHEAYLKLVDQSRVEWQSRAHFFAVAAEIIRRILIDHARAMQRDDQRLNLGSQCGVPSASAIQDNPRADPRPSAAPRAGFRAPVTSARQRSNRARRAPHLLVSGAGP